MFDEDGILKILFTQSHIDLDAILQLILVGHDLQLEKFLKVGGTFITDLKSGECADYKSSNQKFIWCKNLEADVHLLPIFIDFSIQKKWIDLVESVKIGVPLNVFIITDFNVLPTFDNN